MAPDIKGGTIYNGDAADPAVNIWATEIQSILRITEGEETRELYLSHECRNERVPFSEAYDRPSPEIFMRDKPGEFLTYSDGQKFIQLECPSIVYANSLGVPKETSKPFLMIHERPLTFTIPSRVDCPERAIEKIEPKEAVTALQSGALAMRDLFLRVSWLRQDKQFELLAPSRYVNFSPKGASNQYVQPISGTILIEEQGYLFPGYVACAWGDEGEGEDSNVKIEFILPRYHNTQKGAAAHYGLQGAMEANLRQVSDVIPVFQRSWDAVLEVDGEFSLFAYV